MKELKHIEKSENWSDLNWTEQFPENGKPSGTHQVKHLFVPYTAHSAKNAIVHWMDPFINVNGTGTRGTLHGVSKHDLGNDDHMKVWIDN